MIFQRKVIFNYCYLKALLYDFNLGGSREEFALSLLEKFKNSLHNSIQSKGEKKSGELEDGDIIDDDDDDDWYIFYFDFN